MRLRFPVYSDNPRLRTLSDAEFTPTNDDHIVTRKFITNGYVPYTGATGKVTFFTSTSAQASIRIPHGVLPNTLENGDVWTTVDAMFLRRSNGTRIIPDTGHISTGRYWRKNSSGAPVDSIIVDDGVLVGVAEIKTGVNFNIIQTTDVGLGIGNSNRTNSPSPVIATYFHNLGMDLSFRLFTLKSYLNSSEYTIFRSDYDAMNNRSYFSFDIWNGLALTTVLTVGADITSHTGHIFSSDVGMTALTDKSADANYSRVLVSNSAGNVAYAAKSGLGMPSGTTGQSLRHNGTGWVATSRLKFDADYNISIPYEAGYYARFIVDGPTETVPFGVTDNSIYIGDTGYSVYFNSFSTNAGYLYRAANGLISLATPGNLSGVLTANYLPVATGASTLGNSSILETANGISTYKNFGVSTGSLLTFDPEFSLYVRQNQGSSVAAFERVHTGIGGAAFIFRKSRGTDFDSKTVPVLNDVIGGLFGQVWDGTATFRSAASIQFLVDGTVSTTSSPGRIVFSTVPDGAITLTGRGIITNAGWFGIGTLTPSELHHVAGIGRIDTKLITPTIEPISDSTTAFQVVRKSDGFAGLSLDTTGNAFFTRWGVNTSSPGAPLHIVGFTTDGSAPGSISIQENISNHSAGASITLRKARGIPGALAIVNTNDIVGGFTSQAYNGTSYTTIGAYRIHVHNVVGSEVRYGRHTWETGNGAANAIRMTMLPSGFLGINITEPTERLHVGGNARVDGTLKVVNTNKRVEINRDELSLDHFRYDDATYDTYSVLGGARYYGLEWTGGPPPTTPNEVLSAQFLVRKSAFWAATGERENVEYDFMSYDSVSATMLSRFKIGKNYVIASYLAGFGDRYVGVTSSGQFKVMASAGSNWTKTGDDIYYSAGKVGIHKSTPTARLHLQGNKDPGDAPLKFDSASLLLTAVERGTVEYDGYSLYFTNYDVRRAFSMIGDVLTSTVTLQNTTTETTVYSTSLSQNEIAPGKVYRIRLSGNIKIKSGHTFTAKLFLNSASYIVASRVADKTYTNTHVEIFAQITVRSFTTVWNLSLELGLRIQGMEEVRYLINDTLTNMYPPNLEIKAVWGTADADNVLSIEQGYMETLN